MAHSRRTPDVDIIFSILKCVCVSALALSKGFPQLVPLVMNYWSEIGLPIRLCFKVFACFPCSHVPFFRRLGNLCFICVWPVWSECLCLIREFIFDQSVCVGIWSEYLCLACLILVFVFDERGFTSPLPAFPAGCCGSVSVALPAGEHLALALPCLLCLRLCFCVWIFVFFLIHFICKGQWGNACWQHLPLLLFPSLFIALISIHLYLYIITYIIYHISEGWNVIFIDIQ